MPEELLETVYKASSPCPVLQSLGCVHALFVYGNQGTRLSC